MNCHFLFLLFVLFSARVVVCNLCDIYISTIADDRVNKFAFDFHILAIKSTIWDFWCRGRMMVRVQERVTRVYFKLSLVFVEKENDKAF